MSDDLKTVQALVAAAELGWLYAKHDAHEGGTVIRMKDAIAAGRALIETMQRTPAAAAVRPFIASEYLTTPEEREEFTKACKELGVTPAAADWVDANVSGNPSLMQAMKNHAAPAAADVQPVAWRYRITGVPAALAVTWQYVDHPELARRVIECMDDDGSKSYEVEPLFALTSPSPQAELKQPEQPEKVHLSAPGGLPVGVMGSGEPSEREQFEAWAACIERLNIVQWDGEDGPYYADERTLAAWSAWQARGPLAPPEHGATSDDRQEAPAK